MPQHKDLNGSKYGRLTVLEKDIHKSKQTDRAHFKCECDCGGHISVRRDSLLNGHTTSCGCFKKEQDAINIDRTLHGESHSRLWRIWKHMQKREYGAEYGLKVCYEWREYEPFRDWALTSGYADHLTIERVDVYGNYEPSNCKWIERKEQLNNTTRTLWYELDGIKMSLMQAYNILNPTITYQTVKTRYHLGIRDKDKLFSSQHRGKC